MGSLGDPIVLARSPGTPVVESVPDHVARRVGPGEAMADGADHGADPTPDAGLAAARVVAEAPDSDRPPRARPSPAVARRRRAPGARLRTGKPHAGADHTPAGEIDLVGRLGRSHEALALVNARPLDAPLRLSL